MIHRDFGLTFHPENPDPVSADYYRDCGLYHRTVPLPDRHQLYGRRYIKPGLRLLEKLACSILYSGCCRRTESFCKRNIKACFDSDRHYHRIHLCFVSRAGRPFRYSVSRILSASKAAPLRPELRSFCLHRDRRPLCYQLNTGDRRLLCYYGRKYEPAAKGQGASGRYRNVRCYQHFVFSDRWSSDCHLQPECRDSYYNQSHQPLCSRTCGRNPSDCRIRTKVLRTFDDDSTVRAGRSNDLRLCFHRHDRNQAHHAPGDELPQHRHCRVVRSSWYGNHTGTCCPCYIPCLGNNYLRQISGCCGNSGGNSVEYHSSKGEKRGLIH